MVRIPLCRCFNHIGSKSNGLWFECKPYVYCYQLKSKMFCFCLKRDDNSTCELSCFISMYPNCMCPFVSQCILIELLSFYRSVYILAIYWNVSELASVSFYRNISGMSAWLFDRSISVLSVFFLYPNVSVFLSQCTEIMRLSVYRSIHDFPVFPYLQCIHIIHADYFLVGL